MDTDHSRKTEKNNQRAQSKFLTSKEHEELQQKLTTKILELSKKAFENPEQESVETLQYLKDNVYIKNFRHSYANFFYIIVKINGDDYEGNEETLQLNLKALQDAAYTYQQDGLGQVRKSVIKLCDHLALEMYRYRADNNRKELEIFDQKMQEREVKAKETRELLSAAKASSDEATDKLKKMQGETLSVISIFAAIVLAFSGGLSYLSSAISAVHNSSIAKLILTVLACGFILFNTVFILLYVVARILDKSIFLSCSDENCKNCNLNEPDKCIKNTNGENHTEKKKESKFIWFKKVRTCLPYIYAMDLLLLGLMFLTIIYMVVSKIPVVERFLS